MIAVGKVDIGRKRKQNEDALFVSSTPIGSLPNLYIVADGMGGHRAGGTASRLAIESFLEYIQEHTSANIQTREDVLRLLKMGILHANHIIFKQASTHEECKGMGTTFTVATIIEEILYLAHVGDTRLYLVNEKSIYQATTDHSLVQEMVENGYISQSEISEHPQRHIITRAVGTYEKVKVDTLMYDMDRVEYILLCSDGLTTMLTDAVIHQIVYAHQSDLGEIVDQLINEANEQGGSDNIAVIIAKKYEVRS
ncbi:serine/threonine protein phosphatase [Sporanaerobium hydrogeniformans]|uniref:Serine/threonine protein phosphatase n=1 Tax=Sporanaerobium hydrogeniformans TaxID=3072179 RepID=A0AC61DF23_9FIRM|nr:Stp1/IreP family PP2C-type Ser/Thr phosphatase [Sporanaerobium hydrogeniformans]PHV71805.1 serine/threonine protein phosphatase [Sporanaerobium hydrogeniformans]